MKLLGLSAEAPKISEQKKLIIEEHFTEEFSITGECSKKLNTLYIKIDDQEWTAPSELGLTGDHICSDDGKYSLTGLATKYGFLDASDFKNINLQIKGENEFGESGVASMILDYKAENNQLESPQLWEMNSARSSNKIALLIETEDQRVKRLELYSSVGNDPVDCKSSTQLLADPQDTVNFSRTGDYSVWHTVDSLTPAQKYNFIVCAYDDVQARVAKSKVLTVYTDAVIQHFSLSSSGIMWGKYAKNNKSNHYQSEYLSTACDVSSVAKTSDCVHLGAMKKVELPGINNCADINFKDALDLFYWECENTNSIAVLTAQGFKRGKSLADAIDFDLLDWKPNKISVTKDSTKILDSEPEKWWANSISQISTNQTLTGLDTVYIYDDTASVSNVSISGSNISLVVKGGAVFSGSGGSETVGINIENSNFVWIEASVEEYSSSGINISGSKFVNLHNVTSVKSYDALRVSNSNFINLNRSKFGFSSRGVNITGGSHIQIVETHSVNNDLSGISFNSLPKNITIINSLFSNNRNSLQAGSKLKGNNLVGFISVLNTIDKGLSFIGLYMAYDEFYFNNILTQNNGNYGFEYGNTMSVNPTDNTHLANILSMNNQSASYNIQDLNEATTYVKGQLFHEGLNDTKTIGTDSSKVINNLRENQTNWETSLIARVNSDSIQASIEESESLLGSVRQSFENSLRFWSLKSAEAYPSISFQGSCKSSNCMVFDASIKKEAELLGRAHNYQAPTSLTFTPGAACPESLDVSNQANVSIDGSKKHLLYAFEIIDDNLGNNDGFCESGERCVWAPNIGAYQSHGELNYNKTCQFTGNETFSNIKLIAYPNNGR